MLHSIVLICFLRWVVYEAIANYGYFCWLPRCLIRSHVQQTVASAENLPAAVLINYDIQPQNHNEGMLRPHLGVRAVSLI